GHPRRADAFELLLGTVGHARLLQGGWGDDEDGRAARGIPRTAVDGARTRRLSRGRARAALRLRPGNGAAANTGCQARYPRLACGAGAARLPRPRRGTRNAATTCGPSRYVRPSPRSRASPRPP